MIVRHGIGMPGGKGRDDWISTVLVQVRTEIPLGAGLVLPERTTERAAEPAHQVEQLRKQLADAGCELERLVATEQVVAQLAWLRKPSASRCRVTCLAIICRTGTHAAAEPASSRQIKRSSVAISQAVVRSACRGSSARAR